MWQLVALAAGVAIALAGLAVAAIWQMRLAEARGQEAAQERDVARGNEYRSLANLAQIANSRGQRLDAAKLALAGWPRGVDDVAVSSERALLALHAALDDGPPLITDLHLGPGTLYDTNEDLSRVLSRDPLPGIGYDWGKVRLWNAATGEEVSTEISEAIGYGTAKFIADGTHIVSSSKDGSVQVWDAASGKLLQTVWTTNNGIVELWPFDNDHKLAVSVEFDPLDPYYKVVYILDIETGELIGDPIHGVERIFAGASNWFGLATATGIFRLDAHTGLPLGLQLAIGGSNKVTVASDGNHALVYGLDEKLVLWDLTSGTDVCSFSNLPNGWEFSPDGQIVMSWDDTDLIITDVSSCEQRLKLPRKADWQAPAFASDSAHIWMLQPRELSRRNVMTGASDVSISVPEPGATAFELSPNGELIAFVVEDSLVRIVHTQNGRFAGSDVEMNDIDRIHFSSDSATLLVGNEKGELLKVDASSGITLTAPMRLDGGIRDVRTKFDTTRVLATSDQGTFRIWNTQKLAPTFIPLWSDGAAKPEDAASEGECVALLRDDHSLLLWRGKQLALGPIEANEGSSRVALQSGCKRIATASYGAVQLWDAETAVGMSAPIENGDWVHQLQFSPDGKRLLARTSNGLVSLLESMDLDAVPLKRIEGVSSVNGVRFNRDGTRLLAWSLDAGLIWQWDAQSGSLVGHLMKFSSPSGAAYSHDESQIAGWSDRSTRVATWSSQGLETRVLEHSASVRTASFTQDDGQLITWTTSGEAYSWDLRVRHEATKHAHDLPNPVDADVLGGVTASSDGRVIASWDSSLDGSIHLWSSSTGQLVSPIIPFGEVKEAKFTADGNQLVVWSRSAIRVFDVTSGLATSFGIPNLGTVRSVEVSSQELLITSVTGRIVLRTRYPLPPNGFVAAACRTLSDTSLGAPNIHFGLALSEPICTSRQIEVPIPSNIERVKPGY